LKGSAHAAAHTWQHRPDRLAADETQIIGARYPEENDRMTNLKAPLATT
jgi:hypothetical protein